MSKQNGIKTVEFARIGHPDRLCDILADSILDEYLKQDPNSRVAIEVFGCHGIITIGGEVTSMANINIPKLVKDTYRELKYEDKIGVQTNIVKQSPEIGTLADDGAGDSGIMIGYACNETPEMLPLEVVTAKKIANILDNDQRLGPDGKIQVTMEGEKIKTVVMALQTNRTLSIKDFGLLKKIMNFDEGIEIKVIPFKVGGFEADTGLTGRKNVLWYGPRVQTGGGAFAGKDPTKVDRSAAYMARKLAIDLLKENNLNEVTVELAYIIGENQPIMVSMNGEKIDSPDLSVKNIIEKLDLKQPIYREASLNGHFGYRGCPWEK